MSDKRVTLYVYDLSMGLASQLSLGMVGRHFEGIWHTGIVVYNTEYFFGGGIQKMPPGMTPYGTPVQKIELGTTSLDKLVFDEFVTEMARNRFRPDRYHLFENNCNHFTDEACKILLGDSAGIPDHIKNLPMEFFETSMGRMLRPMIDSMMGGSSQPSSTMTGGGTTATATATNSNQGRSNNYSTNNAYGGGGSAFGGGGSGGAFGGGNNNNNNTGGDLMSQMLNDPQMMQQAMNDPMVQSMMNQYGLGGMDMQSMMNQMGGAQGIQNMMNQMGGMQGMQNMMNQMNLGQTGNFNANNNGYAPSSYPSVSQQQSRPSTFQDDGKTTRYGKANVTQVVEKLRSIMKEQNFELSSEEESTLSHLQQFLLSSETSKNYLLVTNNNRTAHLLLRMITQLPEKSVFPALDLTRLLVFQTTAIIDQFTSLIDEIGTRFVDHWNELSMPTQLMVLRVYCNMFPPVFDAQLAVPRSVSIITSEGFYSKLVDVISSSLTSKLEGVRLTAASLSSNLSLYTPKNGNDEETQLLCSMSEFLAEESSNEVRTRMLLTVYRICKDNSSAISLLKELGYKFDIPSTSSSSGAATPQNNNSEARLLSASIKQLLSQ